MMELLISKLQRDEEGQTMAEYAVVLAVITILVVVALGALSDSIVAALGAVTDIIDGAV
jgi:Flp pilus assembly pilin Flp